MSKDPAKTLETRNKWCFGLGTVGRDMFYAFEANALLYFLSNVLELPLWVFAIVSTLLSVLRIIDAINDPITGVIVDNIRSPWGKFKPAITIGGLISIPAFLVLFSNIGTGWWFIVIFGFAYIVWDIFYGVNDIGYWTLLPALSTDQKQREKNGAFARICANVGMYIVMVGWQPITQALGDDARAFRIFAIGVCVCYVLFQAITVIGVKEPKLFAENDEKTTLKDMWRALTKNDQLLWTTLSMALFMVGYCTTVGFALYYMEYIYGDANMYMVLAAVVGVAQLGALLIFPLVSKKFDRRQLYTISTIMVFVGYIVFMLADTSLALIAVAAVIIFVGQAFIQLLMLMFLADTIEYGQWKNGTRNEAVTFSIQPLINKIGGALSTAIISGTIIACGIKTAESDVAAETIDASGKLIMKLSMFVAPLILIVIGYIIYRVRYKIDKDFYEKMLADLRDRGELLE